MSKQIVLRCTDPGCTNEINLTPIDDGLIHLSGLMEGWAFNSTGELRWRCPECQSCDAARRIMTEGIPDTTD